MANSLLSIQPNKVSKDLRGYSVFFYGDPKTGKTTIASQFPGALVAAFEKGYSAIPGIMAKPLNSWSEFRKFIRELDDPDVKAIFQTVVIDTADIAYGYCEKYVCNQACTADVTYETIGDIPYGKGYSLAQKEFDECLRKILMMDYGLVIISHATDKTFTDSNGNEYQQIVPTVDKRARYICERTCDIIGYARAIADADGTTTKLFLRGTPRFVAGSRFKYTPDVIDFTYDNLVNAIADAIEKEAAVRGGSAVTEERKILHTEPEYDFEAQMKEFQEIVGELMKTGSPTMATTISSIVDEYLGKGRKVSDCTAENAPQLDLILFELRKIEL